MAGDRFYFWRGYYDAMRKLPTDAQCGRFVMAVCASAFDGIEPDFSDDPTLDFAWSIVAEQVAESVAIGRKMAERGRKSGEARRKKSKGKKQKKTNTVRNTVRNSVPNERKGKERNGSEFPFPSGKGGASRSAPDGAALAPPGFDVPPRPEGD